MQAFSIPFRKGIFVFSDFLMPPTSCAGLRFSFLFIGFISNAFLKVGKMSKEPTRMGMENVYIQTLRLRLLNVHVGPSHHMLL
jgi:hypothetical protein